MKKSVLTVISDPVCPWCFIGKNRLDRAIKSLPENINLDVQWNPFELNPTLSKSGMSRDDYLRIKFGSTRAANKIYDNIAFTACSDGIILNLDSITRTPNTRDAHKLILYSQKLRVQDKLVHNLFKAYLIDGLDIGNLDTLVQIARQSGISTKEAKNTLLNDNLHSEIEKLEEKATEMGIMGVPAFLYNDRYLFSGAQSVETIKFSIIKAFDKNLS